MSKNHANAHKAGKTGRLVREVAYNVYIPIYMWPSLKALLTVLTLGWKAQRGAHHRTVKGGTEKVLLEAGRQH